MDKIEQIKFDRLRPVANITPPTTSNATSAPLSSVRTLTAAATSSSRSVARGHVNQLSPTRSATASCTTPTVSSSTGHPYARPRRFTPSQQHQFRRPTRSKRRGRQNHPRAGRPRGPTGTPRARRCVGLEATPRPARVPPVDYGTASRGDPRDGRPLPARGCGYREREVPRSAKSKSGP